MKRDLILTGVVVAGLILVGCQKRQMIRTLVEVSSVPEQVYGVTEYRSPVPGGYAVLFDVPGDGKEVFMRHTPFTEKVGRDYSVSYLEEFQTTVRGYRVLRISDQDGTVRAYLVVSNLLNDEIRVVGERAMVAI
ncbi:MAG: hypothetical protein JRH07_17440, partial [Deltaproteobacteria bacterium]|nr:hypothetical protein [Deltaproteobacteria bacterium]